MFRERVIETAARTKQNAANRAEWMNRIGLAVAQGNREVANWIHATQIEKRRVEFRDGELRLA